MSQNLNDFINSLDELSKSVEKKIEILYYNNLKLISYHTQNDKNNNPMLKLTFREQVSGLLINDYLCYGHPNKVVVTLAAKKLKNILDISKTKDIDSCIGKVYKAKLKHVADSPYFSIDKLVSLVDTSFVLDV